MSLKNFVEIETKWGFKSFELYRADITALDFSVDLIVLSSFGGSYRPSQDTVIKALHDNLDISVRDLFADCEFDFRESLSCWVSNPLKIENFNRLLCIEIIDRFSNKALEIPNIFKDLFIVIAILQMKGIQIKSIALPILGAGHQQLDPTKVIQELLRQSLDFMQNYQPLERVVFVEINEERATLLDEEMNRVLGRVKITVPKGKLVENVKKEILKKIYNNEPLLKNINLQLFNELVRIVSSEESRSFELGIIAGRLVEFIADDILGETKVFELWKKIERLPEYGVANWIIGYMHVLRIFRNESAHEKNHIDRRPQVIEESDLALCLFCLQRVIDFYVDYKCSRPLRP